MSTGKVYLMYHELEVPGRTLCECERGYVRYVVTESSFKDQLAHLKSNGFRGVNVSEALDYEDVQGCEICITFDDGCETDLLVAAPLLEEFGFSATFYVVAGFIGRRGYLSRDQVCELSRMGFEIGCHSMTHAYLSDSNLDRLRIEIAEAKERLEQVVGKRVAHFSCPGGRWSRCVAQVAEEAGYQSVATSRIGTNSKATDRYRLARVPVMRHTTLAKFSRLCRSKGLIIPQSRETVLAAAKSVLGNSIYDRIRTSLLGRAENA
jgi:peptidoglycan/xylan/chitin deacetylase (PgdA/CDA1 family)